MEAPHRFSAPRRWMRLAWRAPLLGSLVTLAVVLPGVLQAAAPTLTFTNSPAAITDKQTGQPFAHILLTADTEVAVTVTFPGDRGTFPTSGGLSGASGSYTLSSRSVASAQLFLRNLEFTPAENRIPLGESEDTTFTVEVSDLDGLDDDDDVDLTVTSVNDAPAIAGSLLFPVNDSATATPFAPLTLSDPDVIRSGSSIVSQPVTLRVRVAEPSAAGTLSGGALAVTNTGTASAVTTFLDTLGFVPVPNRQAVGQTEIIEVSLELEDSLGLGSPDDGTFNLTVVSINDPPSAIFNVSPTSVDDTASIRPLRLTVNDADVGETFRFTLLPVSDPTFQFGRLEPAEAGTAGLTGSKTDLEAAVAGVTYRPIPDRTVGTNVTFRLVVSDQHVGGSVTSVLFTLTIRGVNNPPEIAGTVTEIFRTTDDPNRPPVLPLREVRVTDSDAGQTLTVQLSLSPPDLGTLSATLLTGTAAEVTRDLRAIEFTASRRPNRRLGTSDTARLTITVNDGAGGVRSDASTQIAVLAVNGAPAFVGLADPENQPVRLDPAPPVLPFSAVQVEDDDGTNVIVTVAIDDPAKGAFNPAALGGFVEDPPESGRYAITNLPSVVTLALRALEFQVEDRFLFPPAEPGGTSFALTAQDSVLNTTSRSLSILLAKPPRNWLVTHATDDFTEGSLRFALQQIEAEKANSAHVTFALPGYPDVLTLRSSNGPIVLNRNLTLRGPGADRLRLSGDANGDGTPDLQILRVDASVVIEGLTLTHGAAVSGDHLSGGAIAVGPSGRLTLRECVIRDSIASQWGGGLDVDGGVLLMERCLVANNATDPVLGRGGGGVSIFSDQPCVILNSTFSGNRQAAATGIGGGGLYVENLSPPGKLTVLVAHSTFAENDDASPNGGTSVHANVFGTDVTVRNSIFADGRSRNLEVDGAASILSGDGNVSDDQTRTVLTQNGVPKVVVLLQGDRDVREATNILVRPLDEGLRPIPGYPLANGSPAIDRAVSPSAATDQRDVLREGVPDAGALEHLAVSRVVVNEVRFGAGTPQFVELYVPRDSATVDLGPYSLWVDGTPRFSFASASDPVVRPGRGIVVADGPVATVSTPVDEVPAGGLGLTESSVVELRRSSGADRILERAEYVGVFVDPFDPMDSAKFAPNAITLAPQFEGFAFVPHSLVRLAPPPPFPVAGVDPGLPPAGNPASAGAEANQTPFGSPNAFPVALEDAYVLDEDLAVELQVRANDFDADGGDEVVVVDLGLDAGGSGDDGTLVTAKSAGVTVLPNAAPLRGQSVLYDPTVSGTLQQLPLGAEATDVFHYSVVDIRRGSIRGYSGVGGLNAVTNRSDNHRLQSGDTIVISGAGTATYNGSFVVTVVDEDHFSISVPGGFVDDPAAKGGWMATGPWTAETQRSTATVRLTILGANDPPAPVTDVISPGEANEDGILRILAGPADNPLALEFDTDADYPVAPVKSAVRLLLNDGDPDLDDTSASLRVVGVVGVVGTNVAFAGLSGETPVTVQSPGHGLSDGEVILISGYGGHASYNDFHAVTVVNDHTFSIPVPYVDNHPIKGIWAPLNDENRLRTTSSLGADVRLDIRVDALETSVIYNARASDFLNRLSAGDTEIDAFYYAVQDRHGAVSLGRVEVEVLGVNDLPVPAADPASLALLRPLTVAGGGASLLDVLAGLDLQFALPALSGLQGHVDLELLTTNDPPQRFLLTDVFATDEESPLVVEDEALLGNDSDVDRDDTLGIVAVHGPSALGAAVTLEVGPTRTTVVFDPSGSSVLQKLARGETRLDTFEITISDGNLGEVRSLVAVLVTGVNDTPEAFNDIATTTEDVPVTLNPILLPPMEDFDLDRDGVAPDNRLVMVPDTRFTPTGALVTVTIDALTYDPVPSALLNGLGQGQTTNDTVAYTLMDGSFVFAVNDRFEVAADSADVVLEVLANDRNLTGVGFPVADYAGSPGQSPVTVVAPGHGLVSGATVAIGGYGGASYNRTHRVTVLDADTFTLPVPFVDNDPVKGHWTRLRITEVSPANAGGTVEPSADGSTLRYSPQVNAVGEEVFAYTVVDSLGNADRGLVRVKATVDTLNGGLQAHPDAFSVAAGLTSSLDVLANDHVLPEGAAGLAITRILTPPTTDAVEVLDNRILYRPQGAGPFPYTETFTYEISGGGTARASATVSVQVFDRADTLGSRSNLFLRDDTYGVVLDSRNNSLAVLENDGLLPGASEELFLREVVVPPAHGTVRLDPRFKILLYTPAVGFLGEDQLTYAAEDRLGGSGLGRVRIRVGSLTSQPDFLSVPYDDPGTSADDGLETPLDVFANDQTLPQSAGTLTLLGVDPATSAIGGVRVAADGASLLFDPAEGVEGEATFEYRFGDGNRTGAGRVTVWVRRDGAWANSDAFAVAIDSADNVLAVLANDTLYPPLGRSLVVVGLGTGLDGPDQGGQVRLGPDGTTLLYTPAAGFRGVETFTYRVSDSRRTDAAKVAVRVGSGELSASDDAFTVFFGAPSPGEEKATFLLPVLGNDRVLPDFGQVLVITGVGMDDSNADNAPTRMGLVRISSDGLSLVYEPKDKAGPFPYTEEFTYEISDGTERRAQARVVLEVFERTGVRDLEVNDDAYAVARGSRGHRLRVLANDHIKPAVATTWQVAEVTEPDHGGLAEILEAEIRYTPASGFVGTETFFYTASDGLGGTGSARITVKVGDLPASADRFVALSASGVTDNAFDVLANDAIRPELAGEDHLLVDAVLPPGSGATVAVANGIVRFAPDPAYSGPYPYLERFEYILEDDSGLRFARDAVVEVHRSGSDRDVGLVEWTIVGVNDPPTYTNAGPASLLITDRQTVAPFSAVTLGEVDLQGAEVLEVRVVLEDPAAGRLGGAPGFAEETYGNGAYVFHGTAAEATAAIRSLVFTPTEHYVTVAETWSFALDVLLTDPHVTRPTAGSVVVRVQALNDPPVVSGSVAGQPVYYLGTIRPFASITVTEVDDLGQQPLAVTLSFDATRGSLLDPNGLVAQGAGTFVVTGTAAQVTAALRGVIFAPETGDRLTIDRTPPPGSEETVFTLSVSDGFAPAVVDNTTSVVAIHSLISEAGPTGAASPDDFGAAVAASLGLVAIGAPLENAGASDAGAVYVRRRDQGGAGAWGQAARLVATDPLGSARFGAALALDRDTLVVGAPGARRGGAGTPLSGAVYVFETSVSGANDWQANATKIGPADGAASDNFGASVALAGSHLAVGAPLDDDAGSSSGSVYVYRRVAAGNWTQVAKVMAAGVAANDRFGQAVALWGDYLLVGAPGNDINGTDSGSAWVFHRSSGDTWTQVARILPLTALGANDGAGGDGFGHAVAIEGDHLIVGSPFDDDGGSDRGAAYVYRRGAGGPGDWSRAAKLVGTLALNGDQFGLSVALSFDVALVGMPYSGESNQSRWGSAYAFHRHQNGTDAWGVVERLVPPDAINNDEFGFSVALRCGTAVLGARQDATFGGGVGSAYVYDLAQVKAPRVATPLPDTFALEGEPFSWTVPPGTFADADAGDVLTVSIRGAGGGALPGWLAFDPATATLSGTPGTGEPDAPLEVTATDRCGQSVTTGLFLEVLSEPPLQLPAPGETLSYEAWIARLLDDRLLNDAGLAASVWGPTANPDDDLFTNFEEYAFATRLFEASPGDGSRLTIGVSGDGRVAVTFRARVQDPQLFFTLEFSTDMATWTAASSLTKEEIRTRLWYGLEEVVCLLPPAELPDNVFFRVRIDHIAP